MLASPDRGGDGAGREASGDSLVCIRLSRCALVDLVVTGQRCAPAAAAAAAASGEGASLGGRTRAHYPVEQWWLVDTVMTEWCGGGWGICQLQSCSTAAAARVIRKLSRERAAPGAPSHVSDLSPWVSARRRLSCPVIVVCAALFIYARWVSYVRRCVG